MKNCRVFLAQLRLLVVAIGFIAFTLPVHGEKALPEGMKGRLYFRALNVTGYTTDPITACKLTAQNHMRTRLRAMRPAAGSDHGQTFVCDYPHAPRLPGGWYGIADGLSAAVNSTYGCQ